MREDKNQGKRNGDEEEREEKRKRYPKYAKRSRKGKSLINAIIYDRKGGEKETGDKRGEEKGEWKRLKERYKKDNYNNQCDAL